MAARPHRRLTAGRIAAGSLVFTLSACAAETADAPGGVPTVGTAAWAAGEGWSVSPEPLFEIGVVDGDEAYQLHDVAAAALQSDGDVVLVDAGAATVRLYGPDGRHRHTVGGPGSAPGEFRRPTGLVVGAEDSITVWDGDAWRLTSFDAEGSLGEVHTLSSRLVSELSEPPFYPVSVLPVPSGWLLVRMDDKGGGKGVGAKSGSSFGAPDSGWALLVATSLASKRTLAALAPPERVTVDSPWGPLEMEPPLAREPVFAVQPNAPRVCVGDQSAAEVRCYGENEGESVVSWAAEPTPVDPDDDRIEAWREQATEAYAAKLSRDDARRIANSAPLPEAYPPYGRLTLDTEGYLWVETPAPRTDSAPGTSYLVFDPRGALVGSIALPGVRLMEVGADYVLAVREDEFGVQFLGKYALTRSD